MGKHLLSVIMKEKQEELLVHFVKKVPKIIDPTTRFAVK